MKKIILTLATVALFASPAMADTTLKHKEYESASYCQAVAAMAVADTVDLVAKQGIELHVHKLVDTKIASLWKLSSPQTTIFIGCENRTLSAWKMD